MNKIIKDFMKCRIIWFFKNSTNKIIVHVQYMSNYVTLIETHNVKLNFNVTI